MKSDDIEKLLDDLERSRSRKRERQIALAQAELKAIDREFGAYVDGLYDLAKVIKVRLVQEEKENGT